MSDVILSIKEDSSKRLQELVEDPNFFPGWANRRFMQIYSILQSTRWITEGSSEESSWTPLRPAYRAYKKKKYAKFPGGGQYTLVATSRLLAGMLPPNMRGKYLPFEPRASTEGFRKTVFNDKIVISTTIPYFDQVNEHREILRFSTMSRERIKNDFLKYLVSGLRKKQSNE